MPKTSRAARSGFDDLRLRVALELDPVGAIFAASGQSADEWQREITDSDQDTVVVTARQSGKSSCAAAMVAGLMVSRPGTRVLMLAPAQRQSILLMDKVRGYLAGVPHPEPDTWARTELVLSNGSACWAMPASASTIRGFDRISVLLVDEAAWVPESVLSACLPMLAHANEGRGGRVVALSTPGPADGWYYRAVQQPEQQGYRLVRVPAQRVPRLTSEFLAKAKARMPGPVYRTEYECAFEVSAGALFNQVALANAPVQEARESSIPTPAEWMAMQREGGT